MSGERFPLCGTSTLNNLSVYVAEGSFLDGKKDDPSSPSVRVAKEEMANKTATLMKTLVETEFIFIASQLRDPIHFGQ
jgi:hypothetical protein